MLDDDLNGGDLLASLVGQSAWMADALCREYPEVNFFPGRGESVDPARDVCSRCLVRAECSTYAADLPADLAQHGVWAGTSGRDRRREGRVRPRVVVEHPCAGCGRMIASRARACSSTCRSRIQRQKAA